jgi:hypothetical protein
MGTKFVIDDEEVDIPRGINIPKEGEILLIKQRGEKESQTYIVDSVSHKIDFTLNIALSKTLINLKVIE